MRTPLQPASLRRLHARRAEPTAWTPEVLSRLDALHARAPKLWWHVDVVVPEQVELVEVAEQLQQMGRLSSSLLDCVARARERGAVSRALQVLLRQVAAQPPQAAWTSLHGAARTMLHVDEGRYDPPGPVAPALQLAPWARPLCTREALVAHGQHLDTCLGQRSWWRMTLQRQGMVYAIERGDEPATALLVPDETDGVTVEMLTGMGNDAVSPALEEAVDEALKAALREQPDPFGASTDDQPGVGARVSEEDGFNARTALLDALGPGSSSRPAVRWNGRTPTRLPGLHPARWTAHHEYFAHSERFSGDGCFREPNETDAPTGSVSWDERTGGLAYQTPLGRLTLLPTTPPTMRTSAGLEGTPSLWFSIHSATLSDPAVPAHSLHAMQLFRSFLPLRVVEAAHLHPLLGGLPGVWALTSAPGLLDVFDAWPALVLGVLDRLREAPGTLIELQQALDSRQGNETLVAVLDWLGCTRPASVAGWVPRLTEAPLWSGRELCMLASLLGDTRGKALLSRLRRVRPSHVVTLHAARAAGLLDRVRPGLLNEILSSHAGEWTRSRLEAGFAELALARAAGARLPGIRSLHHLAQLLVQHRGRVPHALPPCSLSGPWGGPLPTLAAIGALAAELGHEPTRWQSAAWAGHLCCVGRPTGVPAVTWLAPGGRRGALEVIGVLGWDGQPADADVRRAVDQGLKEHHARLDKLPPGWDAGDAVAAGLPMGIGSITLAGRVPLSGLVGAVLSLAE